MSALSKASMIVNRTVTCSRELFLDHEIKYDTSEVWKVVKRIDALFN